MLVVAVGPGRGVPRVELGSGAHQRNPSKLAPYESGVPLLDENRKRVNVRFYQIAMLFILFDIEAAFLYPWAVIYRDATTLRTASSGSSSERCSCSCFFSASATSTSGRRRHSTGSEPRREWPTSIPTIPTRKDRFPDPPKKVEFPKRPRRQFDCHPHALPEQGSGAAADAAPRAGSLGLDLARSRALRRRAARSVAGDRLRRRVVLQHVQPEAGREISPAGLHEPQLHGERRLRHLRSSLRKAAASSRTRRPRTASTPSSKWSASAPAGPRRSCRSTTTTTRT